MQRVELRAVQRTHFISERRDGDFRAGRNLRQRLPHRALHRREMRAAHAARRIREHDGLEFARRDFLPVGKKRPREKQREQRHHGEPREQQRPVFNPPPAPPLPDGHAQKTQRADVHALVFPRADEMNQHRQRERKKAGENSGVNQAHKAARLGRQPRRSSNGVVGGGD